MELTISAVLLSVALFIAAQFSDKTRANTAVLLTWAIFYLVSLIVCAFYIHPIFGLPAGAFIYRVMVAGTAAYKDARRAQ
jgi:hypothetical protein